MAEKVADNDDGGEVRAGHNGFDPEKTRSFVNRIENVQAEIDAIMDEAKAKCAPYRDDIKEIKRDAADAGLPRKEFNAVVARRKAERKIEEARSNLDEHQQDNYDMIRHALGDLADTPLGESVLGEAAE